MELQFPLFPLLFTFFIFVFIALKVSKLGTKINNSSSSLPPGPWKLPLIGHMHYFIFSLPHRRLRDLAKKYGPLMHLKLGEVTIIVVSSPEAAKEVMKTYDLNFAQRPPLLGPSIVSYNGTNIAFSPYGDYWKMMRKFCISALLSPKCVESFRSIREEEVLKLIRLISSKAGSRINLSRKVFSTIFDITSIAAFGKKCKNQEAFMPLAKKLLEFSGGFSIADAFPSYKILQSICGMRSKLEELHRKIDIILDNVIDEHKEAEQDEDIMDVLLKLQKHGDLELSLTNDNIKAVLLDIFIAGTETSSTTTEWAISELLRNPEVMEKAQAEVRNVFKTKGIVDETNLGELKYLKLVIKETLRLHPPGPLLLPRECQKSCEILGYEIPFKTKVIVNAWAIARDKRYWSQAERFYPERFLNSSIDYKGANFEFIPFGAGRRICPGISFGVANVELPLAQLLYHFNWKLPKGAKQQELEMAETSGITARRKNDLYVIPSLYQTSRIK